MAFFLISNCLVFSQTEPNHPAEVTSTANIVESAVTEAVFAPATQIHQTRFRLLPLKTELTDGNPLPLYLKVFSNDPNFPELMPDFEFIDAQLETSAKDMDVAAVEKELAKCVDKLELLKQCSLCRNIEWPRIEQQYRWRRDENLMLFAVFPSDDEPACEVPVFSPTDYLDFMVNIQRYGKLVALKVRYHIVQGEYETAGAWLRTGLCISRQMLTESNLQMGMAAVSNATLCLQQIELWVQRPGSPSLYRALSDLPQPFLSACYPQSLLQEKPVVRLDRMGYFGNYQGDPLEENEAREVLPDYSNEQLRHASGQVDRYIAILQCIEALRYYAALYGGDLPQRLADITELRVPVDPVTRREFVYFTGPEGITLQSSDRDTDKSRFGFHFIFRLED